jgi:hypothetical protein
MPESKMPLLTPLMCTICVQPLSRETCCAGELSWKLDAIAEPRRPALTMSSSPQLAEACQNAPQRPFTVKVDPLNLVDANLNVGKPLFFISYLTFQT